MMNCQICGAQSPTKFVTFYQNIGALFMRFHRKLQGSLCKSCVHKNFWKMTLITLGVGWLGMISIVVAPIFIIANIVQYLRCMGMPAGSSADAQATVVSRAPAAPPPLPAAAAAPIAAVAETLSGESIEALNPHVEQIATRLNAGEDAGGIAADMTAATGVTPAQAALYIQALIESSHQAS